MECNFFKASVWAEGFGREGLYGYLDNWEPVRGWAVGGFVPGFVSMQRRWERRERRRRKVEKVIWRRRREEVRGEGVRGSPGKN